MAAHVIEDLRERQRDVQVVSARLETIEPVQQRGTVVRVVLEVGFDQLELAVEPEDSAPHAPAVERGREADQRIDDADERHEHHEQAPGELRKSERQIALEERPPRLVELERLRRYGQVAGLGRRKLRGLLEDIRARMDLHRRVE